MQNIPLLIWPAILLQNSRFYNSINDTRKLHMVIVTILYYVYSYIIELDVRLY